MLLICAPCAMAQDGPAALRLVQTISLSGVEGRIDHFAISLDHSRLYVAALGNNTVEVIDLIEAKRAGTIGGLREPQGVGVVPVSNDVVVASGQDGKCRIYDSSLKLKSTLDGLDDADNVRIDERDGTAFIGYGGGAIMAINPVAGRKLYEVKLDGHPESFQLEKQGSANRIFVNVPEAKHIAVTDRNKQAVVATWPLDGAQGNFPMALDEQHHRLFVGCRKPATLLVMDTESGKILQSLACCGDADDVFFDAQTQRVYATGGQGCISVFNRTDAGHYQLLTTVETAPGARTSLFVSAKRMLYLAVPHQGNQEAEIRVYRVEK